MKRKLNNSTMYAKMYLVTPMVYEKLKRCLDKSDFTNLDRINRPFFTTNTQKQTFNQQPPPPPPINISVQNPTYRDRPPDFEPITSEKKIENIVQREMGIQPIPIQEQQGEEFEEVSNPYMDESFGLGQTSMDWDRPIPTTYDWGQANRMLQVEQGTQTYQPSYTEQGTQTYQPSYTEQETQTYTPRQTEQGTQTFPTFNIDQETQTIETPQIEQETQRSRSRQRKRKTQQETQSTALVPQLPQTQEIEIQTDPERALVPVQSVVPYDDPMDFPPTDYEQMAQFRFQPPPRQAAISYEHKKRLKYKKDKKPTKPNLRKRMVTDIVPSQRQNISLLSSLGLEDPRRLNINLSDFHRRHFGQQLSDIAVPRRRPQPPAISEVVFSGSELTPTPQQQIAIPRQFEQQPIQQELLTQRELEGPPNILPLTYQPSQQQRELEGPARQLQLSYQPVQTMGPRQLLEQVPLTLPSRLSLRENPVQRLALEGPGELVYRAQPRLTEPTTRLALTYQGKKRPLVDTQIPPAKRFGPVPKIVVTPPQEQRTTRGSKRPIISVEQPSKIQKVKQFQCDICGLLLSTKYSLDRHKEREQKRLQLLEAEDTSKKSDFGKWLDQREQYQSPEKNPQPGLKRTATEAKLPQLRKTKRIVPAKDFPNWVLRRPEPL